MKVLLVILSIIKKIFNFLVGTIFLPLCGIGFALATNSLKGWNVNDPDGELFVPFGILALIIAGAWLVLTVIRLITKKLRFFEPIYFAAGLLDYGLYSLLASLIH